MTKPHRTIYREADDGGIQLAASADRWHLRDDCVHLSPHHREGRLLRWNAEKLPIIDNPDRGALVVIDMQNDFCSPGGWTDASGFDYKACHSAIPGVQRAIDAARAHGMWVIWVYWQNRSDLRNLGAPTLYSFKHSPGQAGIGEELEHGPVLLEGSWGARMVDELQPYIHDNDVHIHKVRMSGFYGTHLDQVLRTQGINTLFFAGVNTDQCVATTMEAAYLGDYNCVLLTDATATSSPEYCQQAVEFNTENCWGFTMMTEDYANPTEV